MIRVQQDRALEWWRVKYEMVIWQDRMELGREETLKDSLLFRKDRWMEARRWVDIRDVFDS